MERHTLDSTAPGAATLTAPRPIHIVVGHDLSPRGELALRQAVVEARSRAPAILHVVGVTGTSQGIGDLEHPWRRDDDALERAQDELRASVARTVGPAAPGSVLIHARCGRPADEILDLADEVTASLVVVGTRGRRGLRRAILGSVAEEVVRRARCPVLVARRPDYRDVELDAPCPRCVQTRRDSGGELRWCEDHERAWVPPHRYSYDSGIAPKRPDAWALY